MSSIVPGFEYDIFISYRHNDNLDGWVSDFVQNLEKELRSTLKDSITIYFDKNPHDGLLETHNVDKSLEGKLKCLIFIPIISQTYCDLKSFAWQGEFVVFNKLAKEDQFGRDIKLNNGNVASRILPVKIHDLDSEDNAVIENEIGGVLRGIEFIQRSGGVNRPLNAKDDEVRTAGKILFRDQVNKVANAVKEIISAVKNPASQLTASCSLVNSSVKLSSEPQKKNTKIAVILSLIIIMIASLVYYFKTLSSGEEQVDRSIAVLAFADMSLAKDQDWFSDGLSEEILNSLANLSELKVTARTSSFYFKGKDVSLNEIGQKLKVAHIVEGSVRKIGNELRITAQLIRVADEFHIWSKTYDRPATDLFKVQVEIAEGIATALLKQLAPQEQADLRMDKPKSTEAYEYFMLGSYISQTKYYASYLSQDFIEAEKNLKRSISLDPNWAEAYGELADHYDSKSNEPNEQLKYRRLRDSVVSIGYKLNPNSSSVLRTLVYSCVKRDNPNIDSAFYWARKYYRMSPSNPNTTMNIAWLYRRIGLLQNAHSLVEISLKQDPINLIALGLLADIQFDMGAYVSLEKTLNKMVELFPNDAKTQSLLTSLFILRSDSKSARHHFDVLQSINDHYPNLDRLQAGVFILEGKKAEALKYRSSRRVLSMLAMKKEFLLLLDSLSMTGTIDPTSLQYDPQYDFVKNTSEFKTIESRVKRDYEERLAKYGKLD